MDITTIMARAGQMGSQNEQHSGKVLNALQEILRQTGFFSNVEVIGYNYDSLYCSHPKSPFFIEFSPAICNLSVVKELSTERLVNSRPIDFRNEQVAEVVARTILVMKGMDAAFKKHCDKLAVRGAAASPGLVIS